VKREGTTIRKRRGMKRRGMKRRRRREEAMRK